MCVYGMVVLGLHFAYIFVVTYATGGTQYRSWLRHCATSRKVAGSNSDGVTGIFHWHNPSGRTMALGLTQPLTEMSTRNISWGLRRPVRRADNLTTLMCRLSWNLGASTFWNPKDLSRPVMGLLYLFLLKQLIFFFYFYFFAFVFCTVSFVTSVCCVVSLNGHLAVDSAG